MRSMDDAMALALALRPFSVVRGGGGAPSATAHPH